MTIKKGDKVRVHRTGAIGVVEMTDLGILIVKLSDETLIKCLAGDVAKVEEEINPEQITITREAFRNAAVNALDPERLAREFDDAGKILLIGLAGAMVVKHMEEELFGDVTEND